MLLTGGRGPHAVLVAGRHLFFQGTTQMGGARGWWMRWYLGMGHSLGGVKRRDDLNHRPLHEMAAAGRSVCGWRGESGEHDPSMSVEQIQFTGPRRFPASTDGSLTGYLHFEEKS